MTKSDDNFNGSGESYDSLSSVEKAMRTYYGLNSINYAPDKAMQRASTLLREQHEVNSAKEYKESAHHLTRKEIESLILKVHAGENTYIDLCQAVPHLNSATFCNYLSDDPKPRSSMTDIMSSLKYASFRKLQTHYFSFEIIPENFYPYYEFKGSETFKLTVSGINYLDDILEKKRTDKVMQRQTLYSLIAAITGILVLLLSFWTLIKSY